MAGEGDVCPRCGWDTSGGERCPICGWGAAEERVTGFARDVLAAVEGRGIGGSELRSVLGQGTRGAVFLGTSAGAGESEAEVAVKVVPHGRSRPGVQDRVLDSARAAMGVRDPGLATLLAVGADAGLGLAYLVSEYAPGTDLARRIAAEGPLGPEEAARVGRVAAKALAALHAAGAVHRDVRPGHLVMGADGSPRLVETGFAPITSRASGHGETGREPVVGSPDYLAPEAARDVGTAGPPGDVYALGGTLFHLVCGRPPFVAGSPMGLLVQHATREPPRLSDLAEGVPAELAELVSAMLAKDPAGRPSAGEVASALEGAVSWGRASGGPAARAPGAAPSRPARPGAREAGELTWGWLDRQADMAGLLIERGAATREAVEESLEEMAGAHLGRALEDALIPRGVERGPLDRILRETDLALKRHADAAFGRAAMDAGLARREDIEEILQETGTTWRSLREALVSRGVLSEDDAARVEAVCARQRREKRSLVAERLARRREVSEEAIARAREAQDALPPGDDSSLVALLLGAGEVDEATAWALAADYIRAESG